MLSRRRVCGDKNLPYDYEVEYLETSNRQYILTNVYPTNNTNAAVKYYLNSVAGYDVSNSGVIFGERQSNNANLGTQYGFATYQNGQVYCDGGARTGIGGTSLNAEHIVVILISNNVLRVLVDGVQNISFNVNSFISPIPVTLFAKNNGGSSVNEYLQGRIYYAIFFDSSKNILGHFIPVVDKQGVGCMYDKVSKQLFYNRGASSFIVGPRIS